MTLYLNILERVHIPKYGRNQWKRYDGRHMDFAHRRLQCMWSQYAHEKIKNTRFGQIVTFPNVESLAQYVLIFEGLLDDYNDSGAHTVNFNVDNSFRESGKDIVSEVIGEMLTLSLEVPHPSFYEDIISIYDACQEVVEKIHSAKIQQTKSTRMHNKAQTMKKG